MFTLPTPFFARLVAIPWVFFGMFGRDSVCISGGLDFTTFWHYLVHFLVREGRNRVGERDVLSLRLEKW